MKHYRFPLHSSSIRQCLLNSIKILFVIVLVASVALSSDTEPSGPVPGRFLVKLIEKPRAGTSGISLSGSQQFHNISQVRLDQSKLGISDWERWYVFSDSKSGLTESEVIAIVGADNIQYIEQDHYLEFFDFPADSLFANQWYLNNTGQQYYGILRREGFENDSLILKSGQPGVDIGISASYTNTPIEATKVVIAIVDSGTDLLHPDLVGQHWKNPDEIPGNGIDDDHNGLVDDTLGYDVSGDSLAFYGTKGDNDPSDLVGHGTHVAGIAAAAANSFGVTGIAPNAELMSVKIRPNATSAVGAAGIIYAVNSGADVINLSWGTPFESMVLKEAMDIARRNSVFVAVAAGNSSDATKFYPAAFDSVFAVAASNSSGFLTSFTTYGPWIDIVAPGEDILSLRAAGTDMFAIVGEPRVHIIDEFYYLADGTSMASPVVAGSAALLLSIRPDLSIPDLERLLRNGAIDMLDPFNIGDSLPGPDSLSGYGALNIQNSLDLLTSGGLFLTSPTSRSRYTDSLKVRIGTVGTYSGGWLLEITDSPANSTWQFLASGLTIPADSILYRFSPADKSGIHFLRLSDDDGNSTITSFTFIGSNRVDITSPIAGNEYNYSIPIEGSISGRDYDSLRLSYIDPNGQESYLASFTGEYFDSLIFRWNASGLALGNFRILVEGFFDHVLLTDTIPIVITSAFAEGWPQTLPGRAGYSAAVADLNNDGTKEIAVGTLVGFYIFKSNGQPLPGFPILTNYSCQGQPAIYDIDRDGYKEVIFTNELGVFAVNYDGTLVQGWPRFWSLDRVSSGFPLPTVTELHNGLLDDSVIVCIDKDGTILAYMFDGSPYFYSRNGMYAKFNSSSTSSFFFGGNSVSVADITGDGFKEVIASFSSDSRVTGVGVWDARIGQPAIGPDAYVLKSQVVYGSILADLDGDFLPEIITTGYDSSATRTIWVKTKGDQDFPGWPITLPNVAGYRGTYPVVADLDLDGTPEILSSFFNFDISSLYIFRSDGSSYLPSDGRPKGEAYVQPVTFGSPIVANLTGDDRPEIIMRSGYILPGTGPEQIHILDNQAIPIPGWPVSTPARFSQVFSTPFVPLADDIDGDGLMELLLVSEANEIYVWDFDAPSDNGRNIGRIFLDNLNSNTYGVNDIITDVEGSPNSLPIAFSLEQNYPNPFNPSTMIEYSISGKQHVRLDLFNVLGQLVETLVNESQTAGRYHIRFDGSEYATGVYFYRLESGEQVESRKMVLLK